jgi:Tol biopolymer transport system component
VLWSIGIRNGAAAGEPWIVKDGFADFPIGFTSSGTLFYTRSTGNFPYQFLIHRNPAQGESALAFMGQAASWSPDGRSLAFIRGNATGALELIIRSVGTGEERSYRQTSIQLVTPRWLHDGSSVIVMINAQVDGRPTSAFHLVDVATGTFRRLFDRDANSRSRTVVGTVSPDDRTLYLGARNAGGRLTEIVGVDLATGVERPIFTLPGAGLAGGIGLVVSPDGTTLAWMTSGSAPSTEHAEARIYSVGVDGSNYREVFGPFPTGAGNMIADKMRWTPDGHNLVFVDFDANNNWRLMRVPAAGGKAELDGLDFATLARRIGGLRMIPGSLFNLDLSPDGSRALVSTMTLGMHELWALDNLPSVASRGR